MASQVCTIKHFTVIIFALLWCALVCVSDFKCTKPIKHGFGSRFGYCGRVYQKFAILNYAFQCNFCSTTDLYYKTFYSCNFCRMEHTCVWEVLSVKKFKACVLKHICICINQKFAILKYAFQCKVVTPWALYYKTFYSRNFCCVLMRGCVWGVLGVIKTYNACVWSIFVLLHSSEIYHSKLCFIK